MHNQLKALSLKKLFRFPTPLPEFKAYLSFFNGLEQSNWLVSVIEAGLHQNQEIAGWKGLESLICLSEDNQIYDIDIRYAWGSEIFKQNLIDHGWTESQLLHNQLKDEPNRRKLIVYLCESSTGLVESKCERVLNDFVIGQYWQSIKHYYLLLPLAHPFILPTTIEQNFLRKSYATTSCLSVNKHIDQTQNKLFLQPHPKRQGQGGLRTKGFFKDSTNSKPLISVITAVFNGEKYLEQTIQSVINQSYENLEYIIIDGGSSDRTIEIIKKYENQIDYWVSEPDRGISDAFNKGLIFSTGNMVNFINSDDFFFSNLYFLRLSVLKNIKNKDFIYSKIFFDNERLIIGRLLPRSLLLRFKFNVPHETVVCSKQLLENNKFSEQLKYAMDFPVLYKAIKKSNDIGFVNMVAVYMRRTGISVKNSIEAHEEVINVLREEKDILAYTYHVIKRVLLQALTYIKFCFFNT